MKVVTVLAFMTYAPESRIYCCSCLTDMRLLLCFASDIYVEFDLPGKVHAAVGGPGRLASCPTSISTDNASVQRHLVSLGRPRSHAPVVPYVVICRVLRCMYSDRLRYLQANHCGRDRRVDS